MDHLKATFHDELTALNTENVKVADGLVHIREWRWRAHEILRAMGNAVYQQAFDTWCEERREVLLSKAEETLGFFDQRDRFELLKDAYRKGMVMPFVGAGMSVPSGYLGWTSFLERVWAEAGLESSRLNELIAAGQYELAAQEAEDALGAGFYERIDAKFGTEKDLCGPIQFLPSIFKGSSVITTNFDTVINRCYRTRPDAAFEEEFNGLAADELPRYLAQGRRILVRLHGSASTNRSRVLTAREYNAAYGNTQHLPRVVQALCARTLLFMGCSLSVGRVMGALEAFVLAEGHLRVARHYAFLPAPPDVAERRSRERTLERLNIYPVWYHPNEDDESIEAYFYRLADGVLDP